MVNLTFQVPATAPLVATPLTFSNEITNCAIVDVTAASLTTTFSNGKVTIRRK